ncbi:hypothetical protein PM082_013939 [Marasmius tenuissimus]|nr:hypothetical protein PM082_013939 [Marasmius tenuissimus]
MSFGCPGAPESIVSHLTLGKSPESLCPDFKAIIFSQCLDLKEEFVRKPVALARSRSSLAMHNADNSGIPETFLQTLHARSPSSSWEENVYLLFDELTKAEMDFQLILPEEPVPDDPPEIRERQSGWWC